MNSGSCGNKILLHSSMNHQLHSQIHIRSSKPYACHFRIILLTVVMSLKSRHPPQIKRFTVASLEVALISGKYSSTSLLIASRDSEVALSPLYLHLHSRHTLSKDMAPLASGTAFADMLLLCMDREKTKVRVDHKSHRFLSKQPPTLTERMCYERQEQKRRCGKQQWRREG